MKALIAAILILNIAFSNAVFLKKPSKTTFSVFNQLQDIENNDFGKKILDTIALQITSQSPLGDIATLLAQIRGDLSTQQQEADNIHAAQESECTDEINEYIRRIDAASAARDAATNEIAILKGTIASLKSEINNKEIQLEILTQRITDLNTMRQNDAAAFEQRQAQSVEVVAALDLIIEKFNTIQPNTNPLTVMAELNRIGGSNPIMALVQVASTFSAESLANVVKKLQGLQVSISQAIEDDKVNEQQAIAEFQALSAEIERTQVDVGAALADARIRLGQAEGALALQERILAESVAELEQATRDKAAKEALCEEWRVKWAADKEARTREIEVVKQVEAIIATKLDTMKDYLKGRANNE